MKQSCNLCVWWLFLLIYVIFCGTIIKCWYPQNVKPGFDTERFHGLWYEYAAALEDIPLTYKCTTAYCDRVSNDSMYITYEGVDIQTNETVLSHGNFIIGETPTVSKEFYMRLHGNATNMAFSNKTLTHFLLTDYDNYTLIWTSGYPLKTKRDRGPFMRHVAVLTRKIELGDSAFDQSIKHEIWKDAKMIYLTEKDKFQFIDQSCP